MSLADLCKPVLLEPQPVDIGTLTFGETLVLTLTNHEHYGAAQRLTQNLSKKFGLKINLCLSELAA